MELPGVLLFNAGLGLKCFAYLHRTTNLWKHLLSRSTEDLYLIEDHKILWQLAEMFFLDRKLISQWNILVRKDYFRLLAGKICNILM